jgi:signal transduction histidine kinase
MTKELLSNQEERNLRLAQLSAANQELAETQERLIRAAKLASVGTLAAGVAHEIGNPLAGVLGLLEAFERGDRKSESEYLALMKKEIERIDRIIGKLLSFARMPHSEVPAVASVREVFDAIRPLLKAQKALDDIEIEEIFEKDHKVAISRDDLMQIMLNLVLNAADAIKGKGKISIEAEPVDSWKLQSGLTTAALRIYVTDTGCGIPDADATRIFDPFFSHKKNGQGTGLGLSICHNLCDRVGGEIILDRVYKEGARFTVTLPRA